MKLKKNQKEKYERQKNAKGFKYAMETTNFKTRRNKEEFKLKNTLIMLHPLIYTFLNSRRNNLYYL